MTSSMTQLIHNLKRDIHTCDIHAARHMQKKKDLLRALDALESQLKVNYKNKREFR